MRDPGRIPVVIAKIQTIWEKYPNMRLGQLLMAAVQTKDPEADLFHLEDSRLVEILEGFRNGEPVLENLVVKKQNAKGLLEELRNWEPMPIPTLTERFAKDPNNGTQGFWHVEGVRHNAIVRATSAPEAIDISSEVVHDWELLGAKFLGTEMPDMYEY